MVRTGSVTCTAPVNIAVVKYWGKRDEERILPVNSSLSGTLCQDDLASKTSARASRELTEDVLWLNGVQQSLASNRRFFNCVTALRALAGSLYANDLDPCAAAPDQPYFLEDDHTDNEEEEARLRSEWERKGAAGERGELLVAREDWPAYHLEIRSENNFPTAAGLASSASGLCALVYTLGRLLGVFMTGRRARAIASGIARQGSGSACRSMFGGFVAWDMGSKADGSDSLARQVAPAEHWPEMRVLVLVVSAEKKAVGSTEGMQAPVQDDLLNKRATNTVPPRMLQMEQAILQRDLSTFAELSMLDSDDFHHICAMTLPPLFYMNDVSRDLQKLVRAFNTYLQATRLAYTYDAGPNAVIYLLADDVPLFLALVLHFFPHDTPVRVGASAPADLIKNISEPGFLTAELIAFVTAESGLLPQPNKLSYIIHTKVGSGPRCLPVSQSLFAATEN